MEGIILAIYQFFLKRKTLFYAFLLILCVPVFFLASKVRMEQDITKIIPGSQNGDGYQDVLGKSAMMEKLIVRVAFEDTSVVDPDRLVSYADEFTNQVKKRKDLTPLINEIKNGVPDELMFKAYNLFYNKLPLFLEDKDYHTIDTLSTEAGVKTAMEKNYMSMMSPMGMVLKQQIKDDPLHVTTLVLSKLKSLQINDEFELYDGYIVSKDQKSLLLLITPANPPSETGKNGILLDGINDVFSQLNSKEFKDVHAEYFGASAVSVANARQIKDDINLTVALSILSICALLWVFFRKASLPIIILFPILFGVAFSLAMIYLIKGQISLVALGGGAVIIGIAVNYSLHVFTHYKHTRSIEKVIHDLSTPMLIGNVSTVGAFLSLLFVKSEILSDFGLFSGLSLVGAIIFTLLAMPQFLSYYPMKSEEHKGNWIENLIFNSTGNSRLYFRVSFIVIGVLTVAFLFTFQNVGFESDPNKLNFMSADLKAAEKNLNKENTGTERTIYLLFKGKNLEEAIQNNEKSVGKINSLIKSGHVNKYFGATAILVSDSLQKVRLERWRSYWTAEKKEKLKAYVQTIAPEHGFKASAFDSFFELLDKDFTALSQEEVNDLRYYFLKDFISSSDGNTILMAGLKIPVGQSDVVYESLSSEKNIFILDKQYIIRKVIGIVEQDFNQILYTSSILVFVILCLFYSKIELALITFIPMLVSWLWILGFMNLFDLHFNIVNIIISTFIFGLGDDYSIFMMDGLLMEYKDGTKNLPSYKTSILLSAITTLLGIGVLIFAEHPALKSIALISVVGITCVLFISYTFIPLLFNGLIGGRVKKGLPPIKWYTLIGSVLSFAFFMIGCLVITIVGIVIFKILRVKRGKLKLFYHYLIMYFCRALLYGVFYLNKKYTNTSKEDLSKPAIILANHQSFLDILMILAAHPKIVLFTNSWVWNSPIIGPVVRLGGFFCVDEGVENSLDMVKNTLNNGFSIGIFPEGTRSGDGQIKRFHKGAFFLAEQLKLDILPVVIYGTGSSIRKSDFIVNPWTLAIRILPRIKHGDTSYGDTYQEQTKTICKLIRTEYIDLTKECETPKLLYKRLADKYIYKGPIVEWYMRVKVGLEKNYAPLNDLIPVKGRVYDIGCGYGFATYMLAFLSKDRRITGVDYDDEKISVADHCKSDTPNVDFFASDALSYNYEHADAFIIYDVLHYMPKHVQEALIKKCLERLNPEGVLIIRDANVALKKRHRGTKISEFFSVKLLKFNKSDNKQLHFISEEEMYGYLNGLDVEVKVLDQTKYNSNIIYYIKRNKARGKGE